VTSKPHSHSQHSARFWQIWYKRKAADPWKPRIFNQWNSVWSSWQTKGVEVATCGLEARDAKSTGRGVLAIGAGDGPKNNSWYSFLEYPWWKRISISLPGSAHSDSALQLHRCASKPLWALFVREQCIIPTPFMSHMYVDSYRTISVPHSEQSLPKPITPETPIDCPSNTVSPVNAHLGNGILFPKANATHPPIKHSPPKGVTGPNALNLCGSSTS
jgi:hypothetical protein